jgi:hypothetical protein
MEHATITLLSQQYTQSQILGWSGPQGFTLYTTLCAKDVVPAVMKALRLLKAGREELRIHANCGTNLVATALLTTVATMLGMLGSQSVLRHPRGAEDPQRAFLKRLERFPRAVLFSTLAIFLSRPFGTWLQLKVTTANDLGNTEVAAILTDHHMGLQRIRVRLRHRKAIGAGASPDVVGAIDGQGDG